MHLAIKKVPLFCCLMCIYLKELQNTVKGCQEEIQAVTVYQRHVSPSELVLRQS